MKLKQKLCDEVYLALKSNVSHTKITQNCIKSIRKKHNLPLTELTDFVTLRTDINLADDFTLFCIASTIANNKNKINISKYYTDKEILEYSNTKKESKRIEMPLKFEVVEIIPGQQWIGKITAQQLMELRDNQMISYNENTQRTMERIIEGNTEYYRISLNKVAVSQIMESYSEDKYMPNTITLNMREDAKYKYSNGILTIRDIKSFDILDGYHRYMAMSKLYNLDPHFDYIMELRIVDFDEQTARQFIWQEDQKTKMRKVDSDSLNTTRQANVVVQKLNLDRDFILTNQISRNKGIIGAGELSMAIDVIYFKGVKPNQEAKVTLDAVEQLCSTLNTLVNNDKELLTRRWSKEFTTCAVFASYQQIPKKNLKKEMKKLMDITLKEGYFKQTLLSKAEVKRLEKAWRAE